LARIAAVAAPRPEAEPVTIAHKPSFDIRISSCCFETLFEPALELAFEFALAWRLAYRAANSLQIHEIRSAEFILCLTISDAAALPSSQVALRTALVRAMAFPHHKAQEKTALEAPVKQPDLCQSK
jgi:hypothetical protein